MTLDVMVNLYTVSAAVKNYERRQLNEFYSWRNIHFKKRSTSGN